MMMQVNSIKRSRNTFLVGVFLGLSLCSGMYLDDEALRNALKHLNGGVPAGASRDSRRRRRQPSYSVTQSVTPGNIPPEPKRRASYAGHPRPARGHRRTNTSSMQWDRRALGPDESLDMSMQQFGVHLRRTLTSLGKQGLPNSPHAQKLGLYISNIFQTIGAILDEAYDNQDKQKDGCVDKIVDFTTLMKNMMSANGVVSTIRNSECENLLMLIDHVASELKGKHDETARVAKHTVRLNLKEFVRRYTSLEFLAKWEDAITKNANAIEEIVKSIRNKAGVNIKLLPKLPEKLPGMDDTPNLGSYPVLCPLCGVDYHVRIAVVGARALCRDCKKLSQEQKKLLRENSAFREMSPEDRQWTVQGLLKQMKKSASK